jgi:hypothetical protein
VHARRWWDGALSKCELVVSEAVEIECDRAAILKEPLIAAVVLQEASLFPLDQEIRELARALIVPGAIPEKAGPMQRS